MKKILPIAFVFLLLACGNSQKEEQKTQKNPEPEPKSVSIDGEKFVVRTELVHQKAVFQEKGMVKFRMTLNLPGKEKLEQKIWMATDSSLIRIEQMGKTSIFNGGKTHFSPKDSTQMQTGFKLAQLFRFPFSLSNAGKEWRSADVPLSDENIQAIKFVHNQSSESPWYVVYSDKRTDLLKGVTFIDLNLNHGKPVAVLFENYITVKFVPVATTWKLHLWDETNGIGEEILGTIKISDISFLPFDEGVFMGGE